MPEEQNTNGCTEESCAGCAHADSCTSKKTDFREPMNMYSSIKRVIGVVSGKGGVGKSLVTASLARMMREKGYTVGILDADVTGPSIPKMYGIHEKARGTEDSIIPCTAKDGTRIMSVNLLLEDESEPVIWRGPIIAGVVKQFWTDVMWGDIDYLFVDMPPGTGDVPLTVFQSLPVDGVVIVNTARGGLIDSRALIEAVESGKVGAAGLDVVENEFGLYYYDHKNDILKNRELALLRSFPNVTVSHHMAFYTDEEVKTVIRDSLTGCKLVMEGKENPWEVL